MLLPLLIGRTPHALAVLIASVTGAAARRRRHRAPAAELGHDFVRNAGYGLTRLLTQCVESAIGQHVAHRPGAAQASGGFNQANACAGLGSANRGPNACSASTDNENVILVFHAYSLSMFFLRTPAVPAPPQANSGIFDSALVAPVARFDLSLLAGMAPPI